jgi:hypothetical protein
MVTANKLLGDGHPIDGLLTVEVEAAIDGRLEL